MAKRENNSSQGTKVFNYGTWNVCCTFTFESVEMCNLEKYKLSKERICKSRSEARPKAYEDLHEKLETKAG